MPGENLHFNAPGSVFSQLNGAGSTNTNVNQVSQTDSTSSTNAQTTSTESQVDANNSSYKKTRESEYQDPGLAANKESGKIKNPEPVKSPPTKDVETTAKTSGEVSGTNIKANVDTSQKKDSRQSSDSEQGWIERTAMQKINSSMSNSTSNVKDNGEADAKDPDTSSKKSKKPGVGKVPVIDQTRPNPETVKPDRPKASYPVLNSGPKAFAPSIKPPKFSIPKMKLR